MLARELASLATLRLPASAAYTVNWNVAIRSPPLPNDPAKQPRGLGAALAHFGVLARAGGCFVAGGALAFSFSLLRSAIWSSSNPSLDAVPGVRHSAINVNRIGAVDRKPNGSHALGWRSAETVTPPRSGAAPR